MGGCHSAAKSNLYESITAGDAHAAEAALRRNPRYAVKASLPQRRTVWHVAAENGQMEVLRALADHVWSTLPDANGETHERGCPTGRRVVHPSIQQAVNSFDEGGYTALMLACYKGHADIAFFLMSQVCDALLLWCTAPPTTRRSTHCRRLPGGWAAQLRGGRGRGRRMGLFMLCSNPGRYHQCLLSPSHNFISPPPPTLHGIIMRVAGRLTVGKGPSHRQVSPARCGQQEPARLHQRHTLAPRRAPSQRAGSRAHAGQVCVHVCGAGERGVCERVCLGGRGVGGRGRGQREEWAGHVGRARNAAVGPIGRPHGTEHTCNTCVCNALFLHSAAQPQAGQ